MTGINSDVNARTTAEKAKEIKDKQIDVAEKPAANSSAALSYAQQKELAKQKSKMEKRVSDAETQIEKVEEQIAAIEAKMMTPEGAADSSLFTNHAYLKAQLAELEDEWEQASIELEDFNSQL